MEKESTVRSMVDEKAGKRRLRGSGAGPDLDAHLGSVGALTDAPLAIRVVLFLRRMRRTS